MSVTENLKRLNITLPPLSGPLGAYVPARRIGNLVFVTGQLPMKDGKHLAPGPVAPSCAPEAARQAARQCVINAIAAGQSLRGGVHQVLGVRRVCAYISSDPSFTQHRN